jgi:serine/threonine protein kinase
MTSKVYGNRWRIIGSLGEGGQGHVYLVVDEKGSPEKRYALKRLKNILNEQRRERFTREIEVLRSIRHPNVVNILDFDISAERPYFVTDYYEKGALTGLALKHKSLLHLLDLFEGICHGLSEVHDKGVVHRDIKPENILLNSDGSPVIADFGVSYVEGGERHTLLDEAVGGRNFMAPEFEDGPTGEVTPAADVYSLGKLLYWLVSGGRVFSREKHRDGSFNLLQQETSYPRIYHLAHINEVLDKMIVGRPEGRLQNARLVREQLDRLRHLIAGNFPPLISSLNHICRYCGSGGYRLALSPNTTSIHNFGFNPVGMPDWRGMRCDRCGHIELFRPGDNWWGPDR